MNKLFYLSALLLISSIGVGQIERGNLLINGHCQLSRVDYGLSVSPAFHISHELAYMFTDHLMLGGGLHLGNEQIFTGIHSLVRYYFSGKDTRSWLIGNRVFWVDYMIGTEIDFGYSKSLSPFLVLEVHAFYHHQRPLTRGALSNRVGLETKLQLFINRKWYTQQNNWTNILQQGAWMIGGTSGKLFYEHGSGEFTSLQLRPNVGIMWTDQFLIGGQLNAVFMGLGAREAKSNSIGIIPFVRHYFSPTSHRTVGFLEGGFGIQYFSWQPQQETHAETIDVAYFGNLGFNTFISPEVAFELKGGYQKLGNQEQRWAIEIGFQFFLKGTK